MGESRLGKLEKWEHVELVDRLIAAGWTSITIAFYLRQRYGFEVHDATVRRYRQAHLEKIKASHPRLWAASEEGEKVDQHRDMEMVDVLGSLGRMIRLQEARVVREWEVEKTFPKGFDGTREEIKVLSELLDRYHRLMQDYGVAPKAGTDVRVEWGIPAQPQGEVEVPVLEMLDDEEKRETAISFARMINRMPELESPNGHPQDDVDGE